MDYRLLGPIEIAHDDRPLALGGAKQRALLVDLLLHANHVVASEQLLQDLWGAGTRETTPHELQVYLSRLRKMLRDDGDELLVTRPPGYELLLRPTDTLDVDQFEGLVHEGRALLESDPIGALRRLEEALALWRGTALGDMSTEPFASPAAERLEEMRRTTVEDRLQAMLALGLHDEVAAEAPMLLAEHPLRERLWSQLMLALYRCGRQADALQAFHHARERLKDELGIDPGPELTRLHARILDQDPTLSIGRDGPPGEQRRTATEQDMSPGSHLRALLAGAAGIATTSLLIVGLLAVWRPEDAHVNDQLAPGGGAGASPTTLVIGADTVLMEGHLGGIEIAADNVTLDCAGFAVIGPESARGANGWEAGIFAEGRHGLTVKNCTVDGFHDFGIWIRHATDVHVLDNESTGNGHAGFVFEEVQDASVTDNVASENGPMPGSENVPPSDAPFHGDEVPGSDGTGFFIAGCSDSRFFGNHVARNGGSGFYLQDSDRNLLRGNASVANGYDGMFLGGSRRNMLLSNRFVGNGAGEGGHGIFLEYGSSHNVLRYNDVLRSGSTGIPVTEHSDWNTFEGNTSSSNGTIGFHIVSSHNTLLENVAMANGEFGIFVTGGSRNELRSNIACDNLALDAKQSREVGPNVWKSNAFCTSEV